MENVVKPFPKGLIRFERPARIRSFGYISRKDENFGYSESVDEKIDTEPEESGRRMKQRLFKQSVRIVRTDGKIRPRVNVP